MRDIREQVHDPLTPVTLFVLSELRHKELKNNRAKPGASDQSPYFTKARNVIVNTNAAESENCSSFSPLTTACHEGKYLGIWSLFELYDIICSTGPISMFVFFIKERKNQKHM